MSSWRRGCSRSISSVIKQFLISNSQQSHNLSSPLTSILSPPATESPALASSASPCSRLMLTPPHSIAIHSVFASSKRFISSSAQSKCPLPSDSSSNSSRQLRGRVADRPKAPRPSTPLSFLGKSRSTRFREAVTERGSNSSDTSPQKLPFRLRRMQNANATPQKKKKRPPPGPHVFEDLTAKSPTHSDLPFAFRYSYTEIPKQAPVGFQEKFSPFGPGRLDREWDGQAALPHLPNADLGISSQDSGRGRKKRMHELDSFNPPPRKKGVKPVTPPGPFLSGRGPRRAKTREEILGEPLAKEEITELVELNIKSKKQINLGRDGLTHNMLNDFHNHWKRERVVRVKCKGVSTIDMDNVLLQLEDKTGGKVIQRAGGTVYLFRGRNYNYRDRPRIPMMLWRPHSPIYPRLITQKPGGLTLREANEFRKRGRKIMPLCKLAKNGYYAELIQNVREAFEDDDLVRIDCKGLNISDYKKIGAKLRDLVPCVLMSFQREQILLFKGRDPNASNLGSTAEVESGEDQSPERHVDDGSCEDADVLEDSPTYVAEAAEAVDTSESSAGVDNIEPCMYSSDDSSDDVESTKESPDWVRGEECSGFDSDDIKEELT